MALLLLGCSHSQPLPADRATDPTSNAASSLAASPAGIVADTTEASEPVPWTYIVSPKRRLSSAGVSAQGPDFVRVHGGFAVVWFEGHGLRFLRLDNDGSPVGPDFAIVTPGQASTDWPRMVASLDGGFGLTWTAVVGTLPIGDPPLEQANIEVFFAKLGSSGQVRGLQDRVSNAPGYSMAATIVAAGPDFALLWQDDRQRGSNEIYLARLGADGAVSTPEQAITHAPSRSYAPAVAFNGREYGVVWSEMSNGGSALQFARLDSSGQRLGETKTVSANSGDAGFACIVWSENAFHVVWMANHKASNYQIYEASLSATGEAQGDAVPLTPAEADSRLPSMVAVGRALWVTWLGHSHSGYLDDDVDVHFARLDQRGHRVGDDTCRAKSSRHDDTANRPGRS